MSNILSWVNLKRTISVLLVLAWMVVIFLMSAESGDESTDTSNGVICFIASITVADFDDMSDAQRQEIIQKMSGFVRTAGHFIEFAVLGFLSFNMLRTFKIKESKCIIFAFGFSVLYAVTDEIHQYFVPNRVCDIKDIAVDSLGAATGVALMCFLVIISTKIKNRKSKNGTKTEVNR